MAAPIDRDRLLDRFLRYVRVDTTAQEGSATYPSSAGQLELGRLLVQELLAIGLQDARQDQHGIVMATLPATVPHKSPLVALCAHFDTSPETTGKNVQPQVVRDYDGRDLVLPGDTTRVIKVAENPELAGMLGHTIITTDGTTLLGADDKAGIAVIVELLAYLAEHPEIPHGPLRACFTCDEEIGHGVDYIDLAALDATVCYTLDGGGRDMIDNETFSADLALVTVRGVNIHPSIGKGRMVNAVRAAAAFVARLPRDHLSPETADGRDGFLHPYHISGGVAEATLRILLRDFETKALADQAALLRDAAQQVEGEIAGCSIDVQIQPQYRNMRDGLGKEPRAVALAEEALRRLGRTPVLAQIRGGTDGSRMTEMGLPTPNLSTGEHNPHSPLEWTCLEELAAAAEGLVSLAVVWGEQKL
ncbi:MAG: peptidase T [Pirellulales bacterium]